jgi:ABC-2 type transport system permease protein
VSSSYGLTGTSRLFYGILKKEFMLLLRYKVNTLSGMVSIYVMFLLIFFGGKSMGGTAFDESLGNIVVGFTLWILAAGAYTNLAGKMTREASWGTLEQLYISPLGFTRVLVLTSLAGIVNGLITTAIIFVPVFLTAGVPLHLNPAILPVAVLGIVSVLGLGFTFGAAAIRFKRIDELINLLSFGFTGLVAAPVEQIPALKYLPLAQSSYLLQLMMDDGVGLLEIPLADLVVLVGVAVGYFTAGYLLLVFFIRNARKNGVMGHY